MDKEEKEILPGVYITDFRNAEENKTIIDVINSKENMIQDILFTIDELETSIKHLKRTNEELKIYNDQEPDIIYSESIVDNENLIVKQTNRIEDLKSVLSNLEKS